VRKKRKAATKAMGGKSEKEDSSKGEGAGRRYILPSFLLEKKSGGG